MKKGLTRNKNPVFIARMRTKTFGLILALCFLTAGACFASPQLGTWKLNPAKSKTGRGIGRNNTVVYEWAFPLRYRVEIDGIDAKGKAFHSQWVGDFDGKDYPVSGDATSDARAYSKVNDNTLNFTIKKGGKVTATGRIVVAADGKTRTVTSWSRDSKGKRITIRAIYNKAS